MKKMNLIKNFVIVLVALLILTTGCDEAIYDFGYDGEISGKVTDMNGNLVSGDIKLTTFAVHALGEKDITDMVIRIKNDGTYANTKLYPQSYEVRLAGPFVGGKTETIAIDLTGGKTIVQDFQVTPLLTIDTPSITGNPGSTEIRINYTITGNAGNAPNLREIYVSTVSWPTRSTGSSGYYSTKITTVTENQGTATITGLMADTKYFIRVGARAAGQNLFNHSHQISVKTAVN